MEDPAFPDSVDSMPPPGTGPTQTTTGGGSMISFNIEYIKSIPGILKICELFFGLITWACVATYPYQLYAGGLGAGQHWVMFVAVTTWLITLILFILFVLSVPSNVPVLSGLPWPFIEMAYNGGASVLYFLAACVQAGTTATRYAGSNVYTTYAAAAAFAFFTTVAYVADAFFAFQAWRSQGGGPAAGAGTQG
ncbi:hypothetical protein Bbelb_153170 [Branchiostoma belcheri]|nr:hypothetical protein Bbelb_153170 [Branchiostoma belcheri]